MLIGGQAINFWAEIFSSKVSELTEFGPYTSKDVDFYGHRRAAEDLAKALGGTVICPTIDDQTPNTALVRADVHGYPVRIDFLDNILGVSENGLAVLIEVILADGESFRLKIMHPVNCLISRVITILHPAISRTDEFSVRQIKASFYVLVQYISETIDAADRKEIKRCFSRVSNFALKDYFGKIAHLRTPIDPADVLRRFKDDLRLDSRYRTITLAGMIERIDKRRLSMRQTSESSK